MPSWVLLQHTWYFQGERKELFPISIVKILQRVLGNMFVYLSFTQPEKCTNGHYCASGTRDTGTPCPRGFYLDNSVAAAESYSSCTLCIAGQVCGTAGMSAGEECPKVLPLAHYLSANFSTSLSLPLSLSLLLSLSLSLLSVSFPVSLSFSLLLSISRSLLFISIPVSLLLSLSL